MSASLAIVPRTVDEVRSLATSFGKSALIPADLRGKEADIFVTVLAGLELGMAPMAALRSIQVIKGKPTLSADAMVAVALSSGHAEYFRCVETTADRATYETKRRGAPEPQVLTFTMADAKTAGLGGDNWRRHPSAMLRARAKSALARDVYPDALAGIYSFDEAREFAGRDVVQPEPVAPYEPPDATIDAEFVEPPEPEPQHGRSVRELMETMLACTTLVELTTLVEELRALPEGDGKTEARALYSDIRQRLLGRQETEA